MSDGNLRMIVEHQLSDFARWKAVFDREKAEAFVQLPASARASEESGVLAGSYCYTQDVKEAD